MLQYYPITIADKDELNKRNLSPDVHDSEVRDLTQEIFAVYQKIKAMSPTTEERAALQYFQSGLDTCTKTTRSKELIDYAILFLYRMRKTDQALRNSQGS